MMSDALLQRAVSGDERAFEELVRTHTHAVWRHASALLGDPRWAEEAAQDTFLKAHRSLRSFRGESSVRTWLVAICHRVCLDRLRLRRLDWVPLPALEASEPDHAEGLALAQTIDRLGRDERRAFVLVHVLGYSREEAARLEQVPPTTMRSRVTRARRRLAEMLTEEGW